MVEPRVDQRQSQTFKVFGIAGGKTCLVSQTNGCDLRISQRNRPTLAFSVGHQIRINNSSFQIVSQHPVLKVLRQHQGQGTG